MAKLTLNNVANGGPTGVASINANSDLIETALENTLSRDGTSPNQMNSDFDMNNNDILNVKSIEADTIVVGGTDLAAQVAAAAASAAAAQTAETNAETAEVNAETAQTAAELARDQAQAAASSVSPTEYPTIATAAALTPVSAPDFIRTAGYTAAGDGGGALYNKVASEPSHSGKFSITLSDGVTVVWYEIAETVVNFRQFGAVGDGTTDDRSAIAEADGFGLPIELVEGSYLVNSNITISNLLIARGGVIKPANGVTVTIAQTPEAELIQMFDCSLGGSIVLSGKVARPEWFSTSLDLAQSFDDWHAAVGSLGTVLFAQKAYTQSAVMSLVYAQNWEGEYNKRGVSITATGNFKNLENSTAGTTAITHMQFRRIIFIADATRNGVMLDMADMVFLTIEDCGIVGSALAGNIGLDLYGTDSARSPIHARITGNIISNCGGSSVRLRDFANSARIWLNRIQPGASGAWGIDLLPTTGNYLDDCSIIGNTVERGGALLNLTNGIRVSAGSPNNGDVDAYVGGNNRFEGLSVAISVGVNGKIVNDVMGENFFGSCTQDLSNSAGGYVPPGIRSSIRFLVSGGAIASTTFAQNCTVTRTGAGRFTITHTEDMGVLMPQVTAEFNTSATPYGVNVIGNTATSTTIVTWTGNPSVATDPTAVSFIAFGYR